MELRNKNGMRRTYNKGSIVSAVLVYSSSSAFNALITLSHGDSELRLLQRLAE